MRSNEMRRSERASERAAAREREREDEEEGGWVAGRRSTLKVKANRAADDVRMQLD